MNFVKYTPIFLGALFLFWGASGAILDIKTGGTAAGFFSWLLGALGITLLLYGYKKI